MLKISTKKKTNNKKYSLIIPMTFHRKTSKIMLKNMPPENICFQTLSENLLETENKHHQLEHPTSQSVTLSTPCFQT